MLAIFKREFKGSLQTVTGWLFMGALLFFVGLYFAAYNLYSGYAYFSYAVSASSFIMLIAVPILTMRILSEERKNKSDQLILTSPVSIADIVIGKFLAMAAVFTIPMAVMCLYPLILSCFGTIAYGETYVAILGFYLYGLGCIAVGILISSLTENQVIAAVVSFAALFLTYMISSICSLISTDGNVVTKVLCSIDFYTPFSNFLSGTLTVPGCIYFVSMIVLMLFLTAQSIQKRKWSVSSKSFKKGAYSSSLVVVGIALTVFVNLMAENLPTSWQSIDMTSNKIFSITDDTKVILDELDQDITLYVMQAESSADTTVQKLLANYAGYSKHITVVYKDPVKYPQFAAQYTDDSVSEGSIIVAGESRSKVIDYYDLYELEVDYTTFSYYATAFDGEGQVTSAISYIMSSDLPKIYFTTGHDELELDDGFVEAYEKANMEAETINLLNYDEVPEDCEALFIIAPLSDFSEDDAQKVIDYLDDGGVAMIVLGYTDELLPNFNSILAAYGVEVTGEMIAENNTNYYLQSTLYLLPGICTSDVTSIGTNKYIFAPYSVVASFDEDSEEYTVTEYLTTSISAVGKADMNNATTSEYEDGDVEGPFTIAAKVEKEDGGVVNVICCENIFTDTCDSTVSGANSAFFTNILGDMVTTEVTTVSIASKSYDTSSITVTQTDFIILGLLSVIILPIALIVAGIVIWASRKRR